MYKQDSFYKANVSTDKSNQKVLYIIVLACVLMAVVFGLFAVTANPVIISLAVALIAGTVLVVNPVWIIWLILSLGLLVTGLLPLYFDSLASKATWGVSFLGLMLMLIACFKMIMSPNERKNTPDFVWIALVFLFFTVINSLVQLYSVGEFLSGFKRYFQIWGLMFALCWFLFDVKKIQHWQLFVLFVALVQLPFALYERIVYVPIREAQQYLYPGMVPIDVVAGTFGASLTAGGASAEMAIFLIIVLAFLLARWRERALSTTKLFLIIPIILTPLLLGETKAVVVMLPLMFLVLYRRDVIVRLHYWLMGLIGVVLFVAIASYAYFSFSDKPMGEQLENTISYTIGERGHGGKNLNRTTVLIFWAERQGIHDPVSFVFGNGLGSSHAATRGHMDKLYPHHGIGLTVASTLLWDTGFFGFILFVSILVFAWHSAEQLQLKTTESEIKADAAAIQVGLALFTFSIFYRLSLLETLSFQIIFTLLLGYLAWLHRKHVYTMINSRA